MRRIAFDHLDLVVLGHQLHVERPGYVQHPRHFAGDLLDPPHRFDVHFLRPENHRRVARERRRIRRARRSRRSTFRRFRHRVVSISLACSMNSVIPTGYCFRHVGRQGQKSVPSSSQFRHDVHRGAGEHVARRISTGKPTSSTGNGRCRHRGQFPPSRLVDADPVEHRRKVAVFGVVDVFGRVPRIGTCSFCNRRARLFGICPPVETITPLGVSRSGDVEHPFERQLVEVEAVAGIVVGRNGFGIVVDHYRTQPLPADRVQRIDATPVEFHRAADPVGPRSGARSPNACRARIRCRATCRCT